MDRISKCIWGDESISFVNLRGSSVLFANDAVMLGSSNLHLQCPLEWFTALWEAAGMKVCPPKSDTMVFNWKWWSAYSWSGVGLCLKQRNLSIS